MRRGAAIIGLLSTLALASTGALAQDSATPRTVNVTSISEARSLAMAALRANDTDLALALSNAMVTANPNDSFGHLVAASAYLGAGAPALARPAARTAFRFAQSDRQKYEAARVAALAAVRDDKIVPAQLWMRRAATAAPTPADKAAVARDYGHLRRAAKLQFSGSFSIVPSSNVNNGSSVSLYTIDGVPATGQLSADAQALDGTVLNAAGRLRYRLHRSEVSETFLDSALHLRRVRLSEASRDKAPDLRESSLGGTFFELGVSHARALQNSALWQVSLHGGQVWNGGDRSYDTVRVNTSVSLPAGDRTRLTFGGGVQKQINGAGTHKDVTTASLSALGRFRLDNGDSTWLRLALSSANSDTINARRDWAGLTLGYDKRKPLGPVTLSGHVSFERAHYPDYTFPFPVPGGRTDERVRAQLDIGVTPLEYMGFVPTITLSSERTDSNVSRFVTRENAISIGFQSSF